MRVGNGIDICGECLRTPPPFCSAVAAVDYGHPWDRLLGDFKFNAALDLSGVLSGLLVDAAHRAAHGPASLVLAVPLSAQRLRERGYNQSWEIARRFAARLRCPTDPTLLLRIQDTPHQMSLPRARRASNVRGAFAVEPTRRAALRGQRVVLVDDVMTTQATAAELTRLMLDAGALEVRVAVVARTPRPGH